MVRLIDSLNRCPSLDRLFLHRAICTSTSNRSFSTTDYPRQLKRYHRDENIEHRISNLKIELVGIFDRRWKRKKGQRKT